jgi:SAM-dependent methyltransferase
MQWCDPFRFIGGFRGLVWYIADWRSYSRLPGAEPMRLIDSWPQFHDRTRTIAVDPHYFYINGWAARRILANGPTRHVDVASLNMFANLLGAVVPVVFVDYRPLTARLSGLESVGASILQLPFADCSLGSVSCLHMAEHVGLGRYGDPLNPQGTRLAAQELARVLAPGGNLYFALPVGKPRLCFNGCRILLAETVCDYFGGLELVEFSGVHDDGRFVERVETHVFNDSDYACGMFWFTKGHTRDASS